MKILIWHKEIEDTYWIQATDREGNTETCELSKEQFEDIDDIIGNYLDPE